MSNLTVTNASIEVLAQMGLDALLEDVGPISAFSTDFSGDVKEEGDTVKVAIYSAAAAAAAFDRTTNDYENSGANTVLYKNVTLDQRLKQTFDVPDNKKNKVDLNKLVRTTVHSVVKQALITLYNDITAATYGAAVFTGLASTFDSDDIADMWEQAQLANFDKQDRVMQLITTYVTPLLKDDALKDASKSGTVATLRNSTVGEVNDFEIQETQILGDSTPASGENLIGFITDRSGMCVAMSAVEPPSDAGKYVDFAVAEDPDSGLALAARRHYNPAKAQTFVTYEALFGSVEGQVGGLKRMVSA